MDRGYNFMTVDLPGQGLMPFAGKVFRTDTNVAMKPVVDYILSRSDVDPEYLAAYGISGRRVVCSPRPPSTIRVSRPLP